MSSRLSRKEMKTDEVREVLDQIVLFIGHYWRQLLMGVGAVVVVIAVTFGILAFKAAQETRAQEQLAAAIKVYSAPIELLDATPDDEDSPSFRSEEERSSAARERLQALVDERGGSAAAEIARSYLAEMHAVAGEHDAARGLWLELVDRNRGNQLATTARLNLLNLDRSDGRLEEVAASLEQELAGDDSALPTDLLLFELGRALDDLGRVEEAQGHYERLLEEFPTSPYLGSTQQRLAALS